MYRRLALVVVACLALALPTGALAAKKKKSHKISLTVAAAVVGQTGGNNIVAGTLSGTLKGAVIYSVKSAGGNNLNVPFTAFTAKGTLKGTGTVAFTQNPDGSVTYTGNGKVTGGTSGYKGAKGTFTVTGGVAANDAVIHLTLNGTVRY
jgi:hypothetical protein